MFCDRWWGDGPVTKIFQMFNRFSLNTVLCLLCDIKRVANSSTVLNWKMRICVLTYCISLACTCAHSTVLAPPCPAYIFLQRWFVLEFQIFLMRFLKQTRKKTPGIAGISLGTKCVLKANRKSTILNLVKTARHFTTLSFQGSSPMQLDVIMPNSYRQFCSGLEIFFFSFSFSV